MGRFRAQRSDQGQRNRQRHSRIRVFFRGGGFYLLSRSVEGDCGAKWPHLSAGLHPAGAGSIKARRSAVERVSLSEAPTRPRLLTASGAPAWPRFDAAPYLRFFDPHSWTCYHVVVEFHRRELGVELPLYGVEFYPDIDIPAEVAAAKATPAWGEVDPAEARFGDVVTFRHRPGFDTHVGVIVAPGRMLHVLERGETCIVRYDGPAWAPRLSGIFRWIGY